METNEISVHLYRVFKFVKDSDPPWVTAKQIAAGAKVAERTARAHALKLVKAGIFDQAEVFPAHKYRMSEKADKRNRGFVDRIEKTGEVWQ